MLGGGSPEARRRGKVPEEVVEKKRKRVALF